MVWSINQKFLPIRSYGCFFNPQKFTGFCLERPFSRRSRFRKILWHLLFMSCNKYVSIEIETKFYEVKYQKIQSFQNLTFSRIDVSYAYLFLHINRPFYRFSAKYFSQKIIFWPTIISNCDAKRRKRRRRLIKEFTEKRLKATSSIVAVTKLLGRQQRRRHFVAGWPWPASGGHRNQIESGQLWRLWRCFSDSGRQKYWHLWRRWMNTLRRKVSELLGLCFLWLWELWCWRRWCRRNFAADNFYSMVVWCATRSGRWLKTWYFYGNKILELVVSKKNVGLFLKSKFHYFVT